MNTANQSREAIGSAGPSAALPTAERWRERARDYEKRLSFNPPGLHDDMIWECAELCRDGYEACLET